MAFQGKEFAFTELTRPDELSSTEILKILQLLPSNNALIAKECNNLGIKAPLIYKGTPSKDNLALNTKGEDYIIKGAAYRVPAILFSLPKYQLEVYDETGYIFNKDFYLSKHVSGDFLLVIPGKANINLSDIQILYNPDTRGVLHVNANTNALITKADPIVKDLTNISAIAFKNNSYRFENVTFQNNIDSFRFDAKTYAFDLHISKVGFFMDNITFTDEYNMEQLTGIYPIVNDNNGILHIGADYNSGFTKIILSGSHIASIRYFKFEPHAFIYYTDMRDDDYNVNNVLTGLSPLGELIKPIVYRPGSKNSFIRTFCKNVFLTKTTEGALYRENLLVPAKKLVGINTYIDCVVSKPIPKDASIFILNGGLNSSLNQIVQEVINPIYVEGNLELVGEEYIFSEQTGTNKWFAYTTEVTTTDYIICKMTLNNSMIVDADDDLSGIAITYNDTEGWYGNPNLISKKFNTLLKLGSAYSMNFSDFHMRVSFDKGYANMQPQIFEILYNFNIPFIYRIKTKTEGYWNHRTYTSPVDINDTFNPINTLLLTKSIEYKACLNQDIEDLHIIFFPGSKLEKVDLSLQDPVKLNNHILELNNFLTEVDMLVVNGIIINPEYITEVKHQFYILYKFGEVIKDVRIFRSTSDGRYVAKKIHEVYRNDIQRGYSYELGEYNNVIENLDVPFIQPQEIGAWSVKGTLDLFMRDYILNNRLSNILKTSTRSERNQAQVDLQTKFSNLSANVCLGYDGQHQEKLVLKANKDIAHRGYIVNRNE